VQHEPAQSGANDKVLGSILSLDPPIVYAPLDLRRPLGWLEHFGPIFNDGAGAALIYMNWQFVGGLPGKIAVTNFRQFRRLYPRRELHVLCNGADEVARFAAYGEPARLLNHNLSVSDLYFRPIPEPRSFSTPSIMPCWRRGKESS